MLCCEVEKDLVDAAKEEVVLRDEKFGFLVVGEEKEGRIRTQQQIK